MVRLVHDDEVEAGRIEQALHAHRTLDGIYGSDDAAVVFPTRRGEVLKVDAENLELEAEAVAQFVLPVLDEAGGADDEHAPRLAAGNEFADDHARLDGLAEADFIGDEQASPRSS